MALPQTDQFALALLQVTGLILPIVFIALQPFYRRIASKSREGNLSRSEYQELDQEEIREVDSAPPAVRIGLLIMGALILTAILCMLHLAPYGVESILLRGAILAMMMSFVLLGYLLWAIRMQFVNIDELA